MIQGFLEDMRAQVQEVDALFKKHLLEAQKWEHNWLRMVEFLKLQSDAI